MSRIEVRVKNKNPDRPPKHLPTPRLAKKKILRIDQVRVFSEVRVGSGIPGPEPGPAHSKGISTGPG